MTIYIRLIFNLLVQCNECQPLYNNKAFKRGNLQQSYNCQPCNCYGHATSCTYNASLDAFPEVWTDGGGGVCMNCQDNTEGRFCERCKDGFFRPTGKSLFDKDMCSTCSCNTNGTVNAASLCEKAGSKFRVQSYKFHCFCLSMYYFLFLFILQYIHKT